MRKITALLLVFTILVQLCIFNVGAADEVKPIVVSGLDYSSGKPSAVGSKGVTLYNGVAVTYDVTLPTSVASIKIDVSTGGNSRGSLEIRLGDKSGKLLSLIDSTKFRESWSSNTVVITLSEIISGDQKIYIRSAKGDHAVNSLTFIPFDSTKVFAQFKVADSFDDIKDIPYRHQINMLADLGLFDKSEEAFFPYKPITRLEFAVVLGKLLNAESYASEVSPFADIESGSDYSNVLSGLYQMGIIKGNTDGTFKPTNFISPQEVASVCINALGYESFAFDMNSILNLANSLDLFDGLTLTNRVTKGQAAKIIYNLLLADYLAVSELSSDDFIVYNPTKNFLEKNTDLIHGKGVMTANSVTELYAPKKAEGIAIDGIRYMVESNIPFEFLGANCEFFYHEDGSIRIIDSIRPLPKVETNYIETSPDIRFDTISEREIKFTVISEDEEYEYELDAKTAIIYNAQALTKSLESLIPDSSEFEGALTLIDNNGDGVLEAVWIDHVTRVVEVGAVSNGKIKDDLTGTLYDTTEGEFLAFMNGRYVFIDEILPDQVLTFFESAGTGKNKITRAIVSDNIIEGTITGYSNGLYTIGEAEYGLSDASIDDIYVGLTGKFTLDRFNYIVSFEEISNNEIKIGAYLANDRGSATSLDTVAKIKLLTENGVVQYDIAKKVIADGVTIKTAQHFYDGTGVFTGISRVALNSPVRYRLNEMEEVVMIDTVNDGTFDDNDQLVNLIDGTDANSVNVVSNGDFLAYSDVLCDVNHWPKYGIAADVKVLALSADGNEANYKILNSFSQGSNNSVNLAPYSTDRDSIVASVFVINNYSKTIDIPTSSIIVDKITETVDANGDVVKKVIGYSHSAKTEYIVDADSYNSNENFRNTINSLKQGNLVRPFLTNDKVTAMDLIYIPDLESGEKFGPTANSAGVDTWLNKDCRKTTDHEAQKSGTPVLVLAELSNLEDKFAVFNIQTKSGETWTDKFHTYNAGSTTVCFCEKNADGIYKITTGQPIASMVKDDVIVFTRGSLTGACSAIFVFRDNSQ